MLVYSITFFIKMKIKKSPFLRWTFSGISNIRSSIFMSLLLWEITLLFQGGLFFFLGGEKKILLSITFRRDPI